MKFARLALALVSLSVAAACSSDVTGPTSSKPSLDCAAGTYGATGVKDCGTEP
jgi:hypothetical protein